MLSMSIVFFIFPHDVAFLTMLFITLGDPIAGIIGVRYGRHKLSKHSSVEGVAACYSLCAVLAFVCALFFFTTYQFSAWTLLPFCLLAGAVGAASESAFKKLDDNLVMPLLSAPGLWVLMELFSR